MKVSAKCEPIYEFIINNRANFSSKILLLNLCYKSKSGIFKFKSLFFLKNDRDCVIGCNNPTLIKITFYF